MSCWHCPSVPASCDCDGTAPPLHSSSNGEPPGSSGAGPQLYPRCPANGSVDMEEALGGPSRTQSSPVCPQCQSNHHRSWQGCGGPVPLGLSGARAALGLDRLRVPAGPRVKVNEVRAWGGFLTMCAPLPPSTHETHWILKQFIDQKPV